MKRKQKRVIGEAEPEVVADFAAKYRPSTWDEVLGHSSVCKSIVRVLDRREKNTFVFTGGSGVGKTTIARCIVEHLKKQRGGCGVEYREVDAATYSGIDKMRELTEWMTFRPFRRKDKKVICVDEVHALSKQAWQALLKAAEEPPPFGYWIFCTTETGKIPDTIMTRAASYSLKPLKSDLILELLEVIADEEKLETDSKILTLISKEAKGSPRRALSFLAKCHGAKNIKVAAALLESADEDTDIIALCRGLVFGGLGWDKAMEILKTKQDMNPESIRCIMVAYLNKVVMGSKTPSKAAKAVAVLDNFLPGPLYQSNGLAEIYVALANCMLV